MNKLLREARNEKVDKNDMVRRKSNTKAPLNNGRNDTRFGENYIEQSINISHASELTESEQQ